MDEGPGHDELSEAVPGREAETDERAQSSAGDLARPHDGDGPIGWPAVVLILLLVAGVAVTATLLLQAGGPADAPRAAPTTTRLAPSARPSGLAAAGETVYGTSCMTCHGPLGAGGSGPALRTARVSGATDGFLAAIIIRGVGQMPSVSLAEADLTSVLAYLAYLNGKE